MEITRDAKGTLHFKCMDPALLTILAEAPATASPGDEPRAEQRLFPDPAPSNEEKLNAEWRELVQPDLRLLFETANEILRKDLANAARNDGLMEFKIPRSHFDAWLCCLNQARLVLSARYDFSDAEMESGLPYAPVEPRDFALFQMHFYGMIQETIIAFIQEEDAAG